MKSLINAAVFRVRYGDWITQPGTSLQIVPSSLQIATPLVKRLADNLMPAEQSVIMMMNNLRIGNQLSVFNVVHRGTVEMMPLRVSEALQPLDSPFFIRDTLTVMEQLQYRLTPLELEQLRAELRSPRQTVSVYTFDIDRRFELDRVSDELFCALMRLCGQVKVDMQINDACTNIN